MVNWLVFKDHPDAPLLMKSSWTKEIRYKVAMMSSEFNAHNHQLRDPHGFMLEVAGVHDYLAGGDLAGLIAAGHESFIDLLFCLYPSRKIAYDHYRTLAREVLTKTPVNEFDYLVMMKNASEAMQETWFEAQDHRPDNVLNDPSAHEIL